MKDGEAPHRRPLNGIILKASYQTRFNLRRPLRQGEFPLMRSGFHACLRFVAIGILISVTPALSQAGPSGQDEGHRAAGTPVLWREHRNPAALDLYWGPGGRAMRPDLRKLTFIE